MTKRGKAEGGRKMTVTIAEVHTTSPTVNSHKRLNLARLNKTHISEELSEF